MRPEAVKGIQIFLLALLVVSALRLGVIYYHRHSPGDYPGGRTQASRHLDPDYYVNPKKTHAYDVASAKELCRQPVWVRDGYHYPYFTLTRGHSDFARSAGLLLPLERLQIKDVIEDRIAGSTGRPIMAIFEKEGKPYAFQVGVKDGGETQIYADEILYIEDPRQLYHHWPAAVWDAISHHQVQPGMNELQASFALGYGVPQRNSTSSLRTIDYPNGGKPQTVVFHDGKAAEVAPAASKQ